MSFSSISMAAGGLALFLLAMLMMTEGLKTFGGSGLKRLLGRWTSTPLRGVAAGMLVTALVQSSSAVTVAAIGFVNAGLLNLRQALGVIFGTNVGTTMTGWLVSLVGVGFKIDAFALPMIAAGVALRLLAAGKRAQGLGDAVTGFGLFFLGLDLLKDAFAGLAAAYGAGAFDGAKDAAGAAGWGAHWLAALAAGFVVTVLTQSSSAAIALILTAAAGGLLGLPASAAAVIGANVGTTATAALAALKATAAARRLALGHIAFNLITGIVALALLPVLLRLVDALARAFGLLGNVAAVLALFHTVFNVLGVLLLLPFAGRLAAGLERLFRSSEEELARPQHLDATLATTPELALAAVRAELPRLQAAAGATAAAALNDTRPIANEADAVRKLAAAIIEFVAGLRAERMPRDVADALTRCLRAARYLDEVGRLAPAAQRLAAAWSLPAPPAALPTVQAAAHTALSSTAAHSAQALADFEGAYQRAKSALLAATVARTIGVDAADALLDDLSRLRRLVQQWTKAVAALGASDGSPTVEAAEVESD
jgi:phosphate:Na+ symporter